MIIKMNVYRISSSLDVSDIYIIADSVEGAVSGLQQINPDFVVTEVQRVSDCSVPVNLDKSFSKMKFRSSHDDE